jgi:hypothetical protein
LTSALSFPWKQIEPGSNADKDGKILVGDKVEKPALPKGTQQIIVLAFGLASSHPKTIVEEN